MDIKAHDGPDPEGEGHRAVTRVFTASVWQEGDWYVAQALEVDVVSQGESVDEALANLREALELYFEPPGPAALPDLRRIEVEVPDS